METAQLSAWATDSVSEPRCDVCGLLHTELFRTARDIARDLTCAAPGLDHVVLGCAADVFGCPRCGSLLRDPASLPDLGAVYASHTYAAARVDRLRAKLLADLRHDGDRLRRYGVRTGASLVEIGSYAGAFLDFAAENGCIVLGVELNHDLARFARSRGHAVVERAFSSRLPLPAPVDGVWILNCFEELPDLDVALQDARRVLRPGGLLVIRTPNAAFVRRAHARRCPRALRALASANAVLGVPFRRCLSSDGVRRLMRRAGLSVIEVHGREFSSQAPEGSSYGWEATRPLRGAALQAVSRLRGEPVQPWIDVVAARPITG